VLENSHTGHTDVAREHQEVVVGQAAVSLGVNEGLDVDSIALGVLVLEHLEGFGEVQSVGSTGGHGVTVRDGHDKKKKKIDYSRRVWGIRRERMGRPQLVKVYGRAKARAFPKRKKKRKKRERPALFFLWEEHEGR
jgi:hypothetical protein